MHRAHKAQLQQEQEYMKGDWDRHLYSEEAYCCCILCNGIKHHNESEERDEGHDESSGS